jgi:putative ABC transport system permease protein
MSFRDLFRATIETLRAHRLRTFLTMFGIAWGIISIILMVAAGEGLRVGQEKQMETFGRDIMIVFAGRTSMQAGGMRAGRDIHWENTDYQAVKAQSPSCQYVLPELRRSGINIRSPYNSATIEVTASLPPFAYIRSLSVGEGRFYNWNDQNKAHRVAFLGSDAAKQLFASREAVGRTIDLNDIPYTVIGVMEHKEQTNSYDGMDVTKAYIPFSAMEQDFPDLPPAQPHTIDNLLATPRSFADDEECQAQVRRSLALLHRFDPHDEEAASIWDTVENTRQFRMMTDGMKYFLGAVGLVSLLLGGIGVMNIMLVAVRERTREIGVRKAVGATSSAILWQFFVETLIVVFMSGGLGMSVAYGICWLVDLLPQPAFFAGLLPTWKSGIMSTALLGMVALLAALYPANRAASVDPIESLRYEAGG